MNTKEFSFRINIDAIIALLHGKRIECNFANEDGKAFVTVTILPPEDLIMFSPKELDEIRRSACSNAFLDGYVNVNSNGLEKFELAIDHLYRPEDFTEEENKRIDRIKARYEHKIKMLKTKLTKLDVNNQ